MGINQTGVGQPTSTVAEMRRTQNHPLPPRATPHPEMPGSATTVVTPKRRLRWRLYTSLIVVCLLFGGVAGYLLWPRHPHFPATLVKATSYPLYYPAKLPSGYHVDQNSVNNQASSDLVYMVIRNGDRVISLSEQAKPAQSQIVSTTFAKNLSGSSLISTDYGTATIGIFSGRVSASLMTDKTWILVSAIAPVSSDEVATTLKGLQLSH